MGQAPRSPPRQQKGRLAAVARRGRCYPVRPGPVHVLRRYPARGPPAGPLQAFRRAHSLNRALGGPASPRLTMAPRCWARPYPRGPSRRRSRLYMSPTEAVRGRACSGPCRRSVGSRVVQMEGAGRLSSLKIYTFSSHVGSHDPALAPRASGRGPGHPRGPASASGTSRARSSTTLGCRRHLADIWPPTMDDDDAACTRTWRAPRRPTAEEIAAVHVATPALAATAAARPVEVERESPRASSWVF